ncbi:MAG: hypothetical protein P8X79_13685 [Reinekea sp.]
MASRIQVKQSNKLVNTGILKYPLPIRCIQFSAIQRLIKDLNP